MYSGRGRMGGSGMGTGGTCYCIKCGYETPHQIGKPCMFKKCPKCGTLLSRRR